ncbi:hypothetical protein BVG80_14570 [Sphingobacteriales bacterium TSM_CSM]|nr:hypothetical protein BVG80_14570 [Sphingobacteriales bacterium TSM_CSM]
MKKLCIILFVALMSLVVPAHAQCNLPNGSFENWENIQVEGISGPVEVYFPQEWYTLGGLFAFLLGFDDEINLQQTTDSHSGSYAAWLAPDEANPSADLLAIFACNERPQSFGGFYKFTGAMSGTAEVGVYFGKYNAVQDTLMPVGVGGTTLLPSGQGFNPFSVQIEYISPEIPDSAYVIIQYDSETAVTGDGLIVDDLSFGSGVAVQPAFAPASGYAFTIAPNPASEFITLQGNLPQNAQVIIAGVNGVVLKRIVLGNGNNHTIPLTGLPAGLYFIAVGSAAGNRVTQKLAVMHPQY